MQNKLTKTEYYSPAEDTLFFAEYIQNEKGKYALDIGTGSGYQAALLAEIVHEVYTVERVPHLAELARERLTLLGYRNIEVKVDDGTLGWEEKAPFDAILVTAGGPHIPKSLLQQLKSGGRLIIPVGDALSQQLILARKTGPDEWVEELLEHVRFVPLIGQEGWTGL